jgi:tetratricopeptide (TPR) repeat protein
MPYVNVRCTSCGGEIQLDDTKEFGYCLHCGTKVMFQEAIQKIELINLPKVENLMKIATSEFEGTHYTEAIEYYNRVLELDADNWEAIFYKAKSQCIMTPVNQFPIPPAIASAKKALAIATEKTKNKIELEIIKDRILTELVALLHAQISKADLSEYARYDSMEAYIIYLNNYLGCVVGLEFCASLIKDNPKEKEKLIAIYNGILDALAEASKHKALTNGRPVSASKNSRIDIIKNFDKYTAELISLDPDAIMPEINRENVEGTSNFCYIATAIYGSYDAPQVLILRKYRDNVLLHSALGRIFVKFYYRFSPLIVKYIGNNNITNHVVKQLLNKIVKILE